MNNLHVLKMNGKKGYLFLFEKGPILNEMFIMKRVNLGCFKSIIIKKVGSEIIHKLPLFCTLKVQDSAVLQA